MNDFLEFIDALKSSFPVHLVIYYSKIMDWGVTVYKKGCAADYPESEHDGDDVVICRVQDCDMYLCFAKAHVATKEWLKEYNGGY